jgi:hypothetical protein
MIEGETMSDTEETPTSEGWTEEPEKIKAHYSSLTLHRKCPQAWQYRYSAGLRQPITGPAPALHFGSWWGFLVGVDALQRGRKLGTLVVPPRKLTPVDGGPEFDQATVTTRDVMEAAIAWWNNLGQVTQDVWIEKLGASLPKRLRDTYVRWRDEWADQRKHEQPLGLEIFWKRALPRPSEDAAWQDGPGMEFGGPMPTIELIGYIDQAYYDSERDIVVIRDDKSAGTLAQQTSLDDMMDSQLQLYGWGVQPLFDSLGVGKVRAVAYDRVKSGAPSQPVLTKAGALSKTVTQFDLQTYLEWAAGPDGNGVEYPGLKKDGSGAGVYTAEDSQIERISATAHRRQFFQRTVTPVSQNIVRAHLRAAVDTATDIHRTQLRLRETGEAARNLSKNNCKFCDYQGLCRAQMVGGADGDYDLREYGLVSRDGRPEINTYLKNVGEPADA